MRISFAVAVTAAAALTAFTAPGCKDFDPPPTPPFQMFIRVEGDPGRPVPGATVSRDNKILGTTGADGRAILTLEGVEGLTVDVSIKCPDAFTSPTKPTTLRLTRFADKSKMPEYTVACPPMLRHVVVAVKAENGPNLPVVYLNKIVTRTDVSGAAHFALEVPPNTQFQVTLDTAENGKLKPVSPSKPFSVPSHDDIVVFEQKFEVEKVRVFAAPKPVLPKALN
jgi:hypothetical protein